MPLKPTCYFQFVRRDTAAPTRVLQQWWTDWAEQELHRPPGKCALGEWRDIPTVDLVKTATEPAKTKPSDTSDL